MALGRSLPILLQIFLASNEIFPYSTNPHGGVAQLGERLTGSQEVRGSIPLVSTRAYYGPDIVGSFFYAMKAGLWFF